eukprot:gnl/MRDRNA2_/MRDRNA2_111460_c0_seq1.p1 gnl/MRDRNA2_/MRDRNA2_111460_c0~~gnl/MRDRNA2_/MRDRNA2_111460_c0_seq1.p1  ORF type:complete len:342 (-),score=52.79 gnl/MRDRNA2_/MRDRNA2_111460_c0_seq1:340-1305(-)
MNDQPGMHSVSMIILLVLVSQIHAEFKSEPLLNAEMDNATLGILVKKGYQIVPHSFRTPHQHRDEFRQRIDLSHKYLKSLPFIKLPYPYISPRLMLHGAAKAAESVPAATGTAMNIYDEPLQTCGNAKLHEEYCTYVTNSPMICISALPPGSESEITWNDQYISEELSIWDYASSPPMGNYYHRGEKDFHLLLKCDALPSYVLESEFTFSNWNNCELNLDTDPNRDTGSCERFRDAIDRICQTCSQQTTSQSAQQALRSKCEALQLHAGESELAHSSSSVASISTAMLTFAGCSGIFSLIYRMLWLGGKTSNAGDEQFLLA